ncbi:MAG: Proton glutamate symport protein [Alphaproteobacteria bacterium MarineAlpha9_Bin7]|nr:MAG: Proton glutamate symport protein [Alphaproteobacteria bacterium MarineAlpha9_Bin7]
MPETKISLTTQILIAMISGAFLGVLLNLFGAGSGLVQSLLVDGVLRVVGAIFIASLKMMVVPLVFVSLVCGVTNMGDIAALGRIGTKALGLYVATTALAITVALLIAGVVSPGMGFDIAGAEIDFEARAAPPLSQVLIGLVPTNPVAALANGEMLQIIVFALLLGVAITIAGDRGRHLLNVFTDLNAVIMQMVWIVVRIAPIGVFCLIARTFSTEGVEAFIPLAKYFVCVVAALTVHAIITYSVLLKIVGGLSPIVFFRKMRAAQLFAFSTASSNATIPVTLESVQSRLGVDDSVASFTVPFGATINMDGTAIMQGVATVFIAQVYGVDLSLGDFLVVIITATLASIGTAGVPGVGLIMLAMVLQQVGLPVEGIALIIGVDRLLDMMRTAVNITGDAAATCVIAKSEGCLNVDRYTDPSAGLEAPKRALMPSP